MNIQNLLHEKPIGEDGHWHPAWKLLLGNLITQLQQNLSNEGFIIPQQTTDNINILNNNKSTGALIYDSTTHELKINLNGMFKTIQTM